MASRRADLTIDRGSYFSHTFPDQLLDADTGAVRDLTGWGAHGSIKQSPADSSAAATPSVSLVPPASAGLSWKVKMTVSAAEAAKLTSTLYVYDVFLDPPAGDDEKVFHGDAAVRWSVSV